MESNHFLLNLGCLIETILVNKSTVCYEAVYIINFNIEKISLASRIKRE